LAWPIIAPSPVARRPPSSSRFPLSFPPSARLFRCFSCLFFSLSFLLPFFFQPFFFSFLFFPLEEFFFFLLSSLFFVLHLFAFGPFASYRLLHIRSSVVLWSIPTLVRSTKHTSSSSYPRPRCLLSLSDLRDGPPFFFYLFFYLFCLCYIYLCCFIHVAVSFLFRSSRSCLLHPDRRPLSSFSLEPLLTFFLFCHRHLSLPPSTTSLYHHLLYSLHDLLSQPHIFTSPPLLTSPHLSQLNLYHAH
jgi:hypothetical protein